MTSPLWRRREFIHFHSLIISPYPGAKRVALLDQPLRLPTNEARGDAEGENEREGEREGKEREQTRERLEKKKKKKKKKKKEFESSIELSLQTRNTPKRREEGE